MLFGSFADELALASAAAGVRAIYHICPNASRDEVAYACAVAAAAKARGVKRFVYHSVLHPQIEAMPHHWAKMHTEEMLFASGFDLTILQPTAYMQNILGAWRGIMSDGVFRMPYPVETRLSLVDLDDVAAAAAVVLTQDGHAGAAYELVGTDPLSQIEVAAAIGAALKRNVHAEAESIARNGRRALEPAAWASTSAYVRLDVPLLRRSRPGREHQHTDVAAWPAPTRSRRISQAASAVLGLALNRLANVTTARSVEHGER